jgi:hypothetical protein
VINSVIIARKPAPGDAQAAAAGGVAHAHAHGAVLSRPCLCCEIGGTGASQDGGGGPRAAPILIHGWIAELHRRHRSMDLPFYLSIYLSWRGDYYYLHNMIYLVCINLHHRRTDGLMHANNVVASSLCVICVSDEES